jgi:hypothetical protein
MSTESRPQRHRIPSTRYSPVDTLVGVTKLKRANAKPSKTPPDWRCLQVTGPARLVAHEQLPPVMAYEMDIREPTPWLLRWATPSETVAPPAHCIMLRHALTGRSIIARAPPPPPPPSEEIPYTSTPLSFAEGGGDDLTASFGANDTTIFYDPFAPVY